MSSSLDLQDTIAAISSPPAGALRGIVRITGADAWGIVCRRFRPESGGEMAGGMPSRRVTSGIWHSEDFRVGIPVFLLTWKSPRSYTGQDLVEIHAPGAIPLLEGVLADCLRGGARQAEPGEFTLRAFLNGRLDLTQAEAVLGVVHATSARQLEAALEQLAGGLGDPIGGLRGRLLDCLALLEAGLDFVDEADVESIPRGELGEEIARIASELGAIARKLKERKAALGMPRVVLTGPPNAGKSSLFNAICREERAIVSPVAGTTRDFLGATVELEGIQALVIDTAGSDEQRGDPISAGAQNQRERQASMADLLVACQPADAAGTAAGAGAPDTNAEMAVLKVATKTDLAPSPEGYLGTCALTGQGIRELSSAIARILRERASQSDPLSHTAARCRQGLDQAQEALESAKRAIEVGAGDELIAMDLGLAAEELGGIIGATFTEEILDRIFQRFCIGK